MFMTIKQAGEATGKSKATILRAIQSNKISATKDEATGAWMIDPAELHRVFRPAANDAGEAVPGEAGHIGVVQLELAMMQQRLDELRQERERERTDKDAVIADLREDRDRWRTQAEKLLLTDQRAQPVVTPPPAQAAPAPVNQQPSPVRTKARKWWQLGGRR